MSHGVLGTSGRAKPRWSSGGQLGSKPLSIAGLVDAGSSLSVVPPLYASGASSGLAVVATAQLPSLSRLLNVGGVAGPKQSMGALLATIVLISSSVAAASRSTPNMPFDATVTFFKNAIAAPSISIPCRLFSAIVELTMLAVTGGGEPPHRRTPAPPLRTIAVYSTRRLFSPPQSRIAGTVGSVAVMLRCLKVTSFTPHRPSTMVISGAPETTALPLIVVIPAVGAVRPSDARSCC